MPGVYRPYTFADVVGSLQDQVTAAVNQDTSLSGIGGFAEADETSGFTDTMTGTVQAAAVWDAGTWGAITLG